MFAAEGNTLSALAKNVNISKAAASGIIREVSEALNNDNGFSREDFIIGLKGKKREVKTEKLFYLLMS